MVDENGEPRSLSLVDPGSTEERDARAALARLLRSNIPLDRFVRNHLADLIDPSPDNIHAQELVLKPRRAGHSEDLLQTEHIRAAMAREIETGSSVKTAIDRVARLFGVSFKTVKNIWYKIDR